MKMHKLIFAGFASAALVSASIPALAFTVSPGVDFEWYANVGKTMPGTVVEVMPPRVGYIYAPGHWETRGTRQVRVEGRYIRDDYNQQLAIYNAPTTVASGPLILRDRDGNIIPTNPEAYPVDSARR